MNGQGAIKGTIGGVTVQTLAVARRDLVIAMDAPVRRLDPDARRRLDEVWEREAARNPRLFDGPILSCVDADAARGRLSCRRASYRELIAHPIVDTGVLQTSVTGVLSAVGADGRERVLLARRGPQTRVYAGHWELAPSGGLDPPTPADSHADAVLTGDDAWRQLLVEIEEELDLDVGALENGTGPEAPDPTCLCMDHVARSIDIVFPVRLEGDAAQRALDGEGGANWEYTEARWIPMDELAEFDAREAARIIAPTRALLRFFGWV
ncbi:MAG: NUDIX domain-containing protein [Phycisphaerales bacterium]